MLVMAPAALSVGLIAWFGRETRGRDLRELEDLAVAVGDD